MVTKRLTDRAAAAQGWTLAQLAKAMGVSKQHMTEWRAGRAPMPENAVIRAAELAGSDPASTLVDYLAERSQGDAHRVWMEIRRRTLGPLADQGGSLTSAQNVYHVFGPFGRGGGLRVAA